MSVSSVRPTVDFHASTSSNDALGQKRGRINSLQKTTSLGDEPMGPTKFDMSAQVNKIYKYIVGVDQGNPKPITGEEINDPFAQLVLKKGLFPLTVDEVIKALQATSGQPNGLESFQVFVISEGAQIDGTVQGVDRSARYVFAIGTNGGIGPDIMISTRTRTDSKTGFLQLMGWDPVVKAYNYYQRLKDFWIWSGNSFHALPPQASRGKGPFSGHINGAPVMKELKEPWQNWNSQSAQILPENLDSKDPIIKSSYFSNMVGAELLEQLVNTGVNNWNSSRIAALKSKSVPFDFFLQQLLNTTNINLFSNDPGVPTPEPDQMLLPSVFFVNSPGLSAAGVNLNKVQILVNNSVYSKSLENFDFALESNGVKVPGDTHFQFFVPAPSNEDFDLLTQMIQNNLITDRFAACLLMVDFSNPIYSQIRAQLQRYIPQYNGNPKDLEDSFVENVKKSGKHTDITTPEGEFYSYWMTTVNNAAGWQTLFLNKITDYIQGINNTCKTQDGFDQIMRLAEYRRSVFKTTPQYEFDLTFATNNISSDDFPLEMTKEGVVRSVPKVTS